MQRTLITGANGFVGHRLCELLSQAGHYVIALTHGQRPLSAAAHAHLHCDVRDAHALSLAIQSTVPTHVVHLAAITHVPASFENPQLTWQTNVIGSLNLCEALRQHAPDAFTLFVSTSEVYGASFKEGIPLAENADCQPLNPYAASKVAAETAFREYLRRGLRGIILRPFNHIGAGQSPEFVTASFARQIAQIEFGRQPPVIKVGNLEAYRDFLDVEDVCNAYAKLLNLKDRGLPPSCINVCSGHARKISEILNLLLGLSRTPITIEPDSSRMRPSDIRYATGSNARLRDVIDWQVSREFSTTLENLLEYWRAETALQ